VMPKAQREQALAAAGGGVAAALRP